MNIIPVPTEEIRPYWRNPRENVATIEKLKESITKYGFLVPIVINMEGVIIAGHARYAAMVQLEEPTIPCIRLDISDEKARAFRVADNRAGEFSEWDVDKLKEELKELEVSDIADFFNTPEWVDLLDLSGFLEPEEGEEVADSSEEGSSKEEKEPTEAELMCPYCLEDTVITLDELRRLDEEQNGGGEEAEEETDGE